jgi:hypothetical protein
MPDSLGQFEQIILTAILSLRDKVTIHEKGGTACGAQEDLLLARFTSRSTVWKTKVSSLPAFPIRRLRGAAAPNAFIA